MFSKKICFNMQMLIFFSSKNLIKSELEKSIYDKYKVNYS